MKKATLIFLSVFIIIPQVYTQNVAEQKPINTPYTYYVWMKEFLYVSCYLYWVIDFKKISNYVICCTECNYPINCLYTYGFYTGAADNQVLTDLKKVMRKGSKELIIKFLLKLHTEKQTECPKCGKCGSWQDLNRQSLKGREPV
jgi:hypothetical protein